jgi:hypothetical protein
MTHYQVSLSGPGIRGGRVPASLLRDLLEVLVEGARRALRLRVEGRSTARGAMPGWLTTASAFEVVGLSPGSTVIEIDAPRLDDALESLLPQLGLFEEIDGSKTSVTLLAESLDDAIVGKTDSDQFDYGLLQKFQELERVFERGVAAVQLRDSEPGTEGRVLTIRPDALEKIEQLRQQTPPNQYVRIAGRLDVIRHSNRMFALILESGTTLRGVAERFPPETMAQLFGKQVIVSGTAIFRPSGRVQTIEAERIELAEGDVSLWSLEPRPLFTDLARKELYREQGPRSGINAVIGAWPGEESDEELRTVLEELS